MGLFRMILAISVLIAHIDDMPGDSIVSRKLLGINIWSGHAVFAFFIISGFYMSLVINEKYIQSEKGVSRFYLNRALRLYPIHWATLSLYAVLFFCLNVPSFLIGEDYGKPWLFTWSCFSNTTFFGVEWIPLFNADGWKFVIGPVWSLGVEISFYLVAPFIVAKKLKILVALTIVFILFRFSLYFFGVKLLPWRYFFFPADFCFFLLGSISYRIYAARERIRGWRILGVVSAAVLIFCNFYEPLWTAPDLDKWQSWCFFLLVWISTPFLFSLTQKNTIDNWIGQLTYPVYMVHMLVITTISLAYHGRMDKGVLAFLGTLILAIALYSFIDHPIERIRRKVIRRGSFQSSGD